MKFFIETKHNQQGRTEAPGFEFTNGDCGQSLQDIVEDELTDTDSAISDGITLPVGGTLTVRRLA